MPDWRKKEDYAFTEALDRRGWTWEFMRRNESYRTDYESFVSTHARIYEPPRLEGESVTDWALRAERQGTEPVSVNRKWFYASKWGIWPPMKDPSDDIAPEFRLPYPKVVSSEEVADYFGPAVSSIATKEEQPFAPVEPAFDRPILAFHLWQPLKPQMQQAKRVLKEMQKALERKKQELQELQDQEKIDAVNPAKTSNKGWSVPQWISDPLSKVAKKKNKKKKIVAPSSANVHKDVWLRYLRLLDAFATGAKANYIVTVIEDYQDKDDTHAGGYEAQTALSYHKIAANRLVNDPLRILDMTPGKN